MQSGVSMQGDLVCFGEQVTNQEQIFPQTYLNDFAKKAKMKKDMTKKVKDGSSSLVDTREYIAMQHRN